MNDEKARENGRRKKRAASKGPKRRVGGNHGNGTRTQFKPGTNSHTGEVFRRGPDQIPRGSVTLMLRTVLADKRQEIYNQLCELTKTPMGALAFCREAGDRIEGKSTQRHEITPPRQTFFGPAPDPELTPPGAPPSTIEAVPSAGREPSLLGANGERFRPI